MAAPSYITGTKDHVETVNVGGTTLSDSGVDTGTTGSDRAFVVAVIYEQVTSTVAVSSVTLAGNSLTKIGEVKASQDSFGLTQSIEIWRLLDPPTGSGQTVQATFNESVNYDAALVWATFQDVDQATPTGATQSGTGASTTASTDTTVSITTISADSLVVSASVVDGGGETGDLAASTDDTAIEIQTLTEAETTNPGRGFSSILVRQSAPTAGSYDTGFRPAVTTSNDFSVFAFELKGTSTGGTTVSGSGSLSAQSASASGTGEREVTGSGSVSAQSSSTAGTGAREITGSGSPSAQSAATSGSGFVGTDGSGSLQAQSSTVSGTGTREVTGTGGLSAQSASVSGTAERQITGSGAVQAQSASISGTDGTAQPVRGGGMAYHVDDIEQNDDEEVMEIVRAFLRWVA